MAVQFFDIKEQNKKFKKQLDTAIKEVVDSGRYILGDRVATFEKEFAKYCGTKYAVGVASGTDALHLALLACGISAGDEVITPPFTFIASSEVINYIGAKPVFVDIEPKTFLMDANRTKEKITPKTKAILPVHLYGLASEMDTIQKIAQENNLKIIEDCAQAQGAEFNGKKVGSLGDAGAFSFFPTKNLGCFGDGGVITTNDQKTYEMVKTLRMHGSDKAYYHDIIGYNSRLASLQAAILSVKLPHTDEFIAARRKNADLYKDLLKDVEQIKLPFEPKICKHTYNQFTIRAKDRDNLVSYLKEKQIGAMIYYPLGLHEQKAFKYLGYKKGDFPNCEAAQAEVLSLPIYPELGSVAIEEVAAAIKAFYKK